MNEVLFDTKLACWCDLNLTHGPVYLPRACNRNHYVSSMVPLWAGLAAGCVPTYCL